MGTVTFKNGIKYIHGEQTPTELKKIKAKDFELYQILTNKNKKIK